MKWFRRRKEPEYPYESFFFDFSSLGGEPTPKSVNAQYPEGALRREAYKYLMSRHPDDVRYVLHYCQTDARLGICDDEQFELCFRHVDRGLALPDVGGCHEELRKLRLRLESQQAEMADEFSPEELSAGSGYHEELTQLRREKRHGDSLERFEEVRDHEPVGLNGGADDRRFWGLFQLAIDAHFEQRRPEEGLALMTEYERRRIGVKLTPIPDYTVQPKVIGYIAQRSISQARKRLQFWLRNSKVVSICDPIRHHAEFSALFPETQDPSGPNY